MNLMNINDNTFFKYSNEHICINRNTSNSCDSGGACSNCFNSIPMMLNH